MSGGFESCWAVDWSGARRGYRGVAVARADAGRRVVASVSPPPGSTSWTRAALVERLVAELARGRPMLIGFDFAFSFAGESRAALGLDPGWSLREVWAEVERRCAGDADHYGGAFVAAAPAGVYWHRGCGRPAGWQEGLRRVDLHARTAARVHPESVLKLVGARQVGRAALAGMRALDALCAAAGPRLAVWPGAVRPGQSVVVEIFPTLFRRAALGRVAKIRDAATLTRALAAWNARLPAGMEAAGGSLSDDLTDALVSAAAMRQIARAPDALAPPRDVDAAREGWIFGVAQ